MYKILIMPPARAVLNGLPRKRAERILAIVRQVAADPFARHPNIDRLKGERGAFRYRLGDWRLLYNVDSKRRTLTLANIRPRGSAYR